MEARATELGVSFNSRTKDDTLATRIAEAETPAVRVAARVLWRNVWSSEGKHLKDEEYEFLPGDFDLLDSKDAIKRV